MIWEKNGTVKKVKVTCICLGMNFEAVNEDHARFVAISVLFSSDSLFLLYKVAYSLWLQIINATYKPKQYDETALRKHAYSNLLKISPPKNWKKNQIKISDIFHTFAQNIDCGYSLEPPRRGGSNVYPQSMFWAKIRKIMYTPVNPSFII